MNRDRILNSLGFSLIGLCFVLALGRVFFFGARDTIAGTRTIRIAHWQLEAGMRDAIDALGAEYSRLHPDVRVQQIPVPDRIFTNWLVTQLTGGNAPDLVELGIGSSDERTARYFLPLSEEVQKPNPYNAGTDLEGVPWRNTFADGLNSWSSYNEQLLDWYGIPLSVINTRLYYNADLYAEIMGRDAPPPRTFADLIAVCTKVDAWALLNKRTVVPIAASSQTSRIMLFNLFSSQTQRLNLRVDESLNGNLSLGGDDLAYRFLDRTWSFRDPASRSGLQAMSRVAREMPPGFANARREDANFAFLQGKALMISGGSWDIRSFSDEAPFRVGIIRFPTPARDDPDYGAFTLGPFSEAGNGTGMSFLLARNSRHPEVALDFLRFMTSKAGNKIFTDRSYWPPAVLGVEPPPEVAPFMPSTTGYPGGIDLNFHSRADSARTIDTHLYRLASADNPVDSFIAGVERDLPAALVSDIRRSYQGTRRTLVRNDSTLAYLLWADLQARQGGNIDANTERKVGLLIHQVDDADASLLRIEANLDANGYSLTP